MLARVKAILVVTVGAAIVVGCGRVPLDDGGGSAGSGVAGGSGTGSAGSGATGGSGTGSAGTCGPGASCPPSCGDILDEGTCKARPDCRADECQVCGQVSFSCDRADEPAPSCPLHTCIKPSCSGLGEAMCDAAPGCAAVHCPDCIGGNFFAACLGPGERFGCGPCPPACSTLDETSCKARSDCHPGYCANCSNAQLFTTCLGPNEAAACPAYACPAVHPPCAGLGEAACNARGDCQAGYCNWCQQRAFVGCAEPGTPVGCPTEGPPCPTVCAGINDQLSCDARSDCHSLFGKCLTCDCPAPGCPVIFQRCADGAKALCKGSPICQVAPPDCGSGFVPAYNPMCWDGCVRPTECRP